MSVNREGQLRRGSCREYHVKSVYFLVLSKQGEGEEWINILLQIYKKGWCIIKEGKSAAFEEKC